MKLHVCAPLGYLSSLVLLLVLPTIALASDKQTIRVPEDHQTIQGAIDAAREGDTVLVGPGTYRERIRLKGGIVLRSVGDDATGRLGLKRAEVTIIDGGGERGTSAGITLASGATVDGFTVTNVGTYDDKKWEVHHATQGNEQEHEQIGEPGAAGISIVGVSCTIQNNIVHHIGSTGIAIQGIPGKSCSPHVYRNVCFRNMGGGIGSMNKSTAVIEENVCFENFYAGIGHEDASPRVIRNRCYANIRAGIGISEGACPLVRGNKCYQNRRAGIGVRTGPSTRPLLEDNDCYENDMAGIGAEEESAPLIRNNRCYKNKLAGIGSRTQATPTIVGNECYGNAAAGIGQDSDAVTVLIDNHCHDNLESGIGFAECKSGQSTVLNNRVINNAKVAIGIHSGWQVRLAGNELSREGGMPPIVMILAGAEATMTGNKLRGGGVAAIRVAGKLTADGNELAGAELRRGGPPNFGVWALAGADVTLSNNKIHGWRHGLFATEAAVSASANSVSNFHQTALVVQQPTRPADVYGNTAFSSDTKDKALALDGDAGVIRDNVVRNNSE
jgi:hypothetical protein